MLAENKILAGHGFSAERVEKIRLNRKTAEIIAHQENEKKNLEHAQAEARKTALGRLEQQIAEALEQQTGAEIRQQQTRKRICDSSEELLVLKQKLLTAKISRDRAAQLMEQQYREAEDLREETAFMEKLEIARLEELEAEKQQEYLKEGQRAQAKLVQQKQIADREADKKRALEEHLAEKTQVDAIVDKIRQEDAREINTRKAKQLETRKHLNDFMVDHFLAKACVPNQKAIIEARICISSASNTIGIASANATPLDHAQAIEAMSTMINKKTKR